MTAAAGIASSWFALQGSTIVSGLGSHSLPTVTASLTLAQRSAVLAAAAPGLALQKDAASLDSEAAKLTVLMGEQKSRLASLRQLSAPPAILDQIESMTTALGGKIDVLKALSAQRIAVSDHLEKNVADTLSAFQDLNDFARPLLEATQGEVDSLLEDVKTGSPAAAAANTARLTGTAMPILRALTGIEANSNLANGMLAAAANAPDDEAFNDIKTQYNWGELYLNKAIKAFGPGPDGEKLAKLSAALLSAGSGKDGIFALREARTALDGDIEVALKEMVKIANGLAIQVSQLVDQERAAATTAVSASGTTTWRSLIVNAVTGSLVVLASVLIGWLYVGRGVVRRLDRLARAMGSLAAGDRSVSVDTHGRDEIATMAEAVHVFKDNMIRGDGLAAETERHAAARARDEVERAAAADRQAKVVEGLAEGLSRLAKGDLTHELREPFADDYEVLRSDFNAAVSQLKSVMQQVVANASSIRNGTGEISSAADDLSRRTEQQAASLEETAAALGEITATVRHAAEGARQARDVVGTAKNDAEQSGHVVSRAVEAMTGIEESSSQIGRIVGVIDEIAFQTSLLALNAGVEAARAGDAGRGFAVVASEVRALAQRSAEAAKEIKGLISTSSQHVEQGVDLVRQTGEALQRIVVQVARIDGIVNEIATSAQEQATSLDQVNTAVTQMDQVTQQNAAMVEESTAASHSLAREAEGLSDLTGQFVVGGEEDEAVVTPMRRPGRSQPAAAMKPMGRGGAALKPASAADAWEEF